MLSKIREALFTVLLVTSITDWAWFTRQLKRETICRREQGPWGCLHQEGGTRDPSEIVNVSGHRHLRLLLTFTLLMAGVEAEGRQQGQYPECHNSMTLNLIPNRNKTLCPVFRSNHLWRWNNRSEYKLPPNLLEFKPHLSQLKPQSVSAPLRLTSQRANRRSMTFLEAR